MKIMTVGQVDFLMQGNGWEDVLRHCWLACNGFIAIMLMQHKTRVA